MCLLGFFCKRLEHQAIAIDQGLVKWHESVGCAARESTTGETILDAFGAAPGEPILDAFGAAPGQPILDAFGVAPGQPILDAAGVPRAFEPVLDAVPATALVAILWVLTSSAQAYRSPGVVSLGPPSNRSPPIFLASSLCGVDFLLAAELVPSTKLTSWVPSERMISVSLATVRLSSL